MNNIEEQIEKQMNEIASRNKNALNAAQIVPLSPDWPFSTNGLYLMLANQGCGKSRFIIKHILMCEQLFNEPYYQQIVYCSTSGELDKTISTYINSKIIKTPLIEVPDSKLLEFLSQHLKRKKKFYAFIEYIQSGFKTINKTLQACIDKHNLKKRIKIKKPNKLLPYDVLDTLPQYSNSTVMNNRIDLITTEEKPDKTKLLKYIMSKFQKYNYNKSIVPILIILDDFAANPLLENKRSPLARLMTKCRHYHTTFIVSIQTCKYVIKEIRRMTTDLVVWQGINEEDFFNLFKEIQFSYNVDELWQEYKKLPNQKCHLILNVKAHDYRFVYVNIAFNDYAETAPKLKYKKIKPKI